MKTDTWYVVHVYEYAYNPEYWHETTDDSAHEVKRTGGLNVKGSAVVYSHTPGKTYRYLVPNHE